MKRWILGLLFACALPALTPACSDDARVRHARDDEAGAGGNDDEDRGAAGQSQSAGQAGAAPMGEAGRGGDSANNAGEGGQGVGNIAGNPGSGGANSSGGAACDAFDDLLAPRPMCSSLRSCYPDLQQVATQCAAPGDGEDIDGYSFSEFAAYPNLAAIRSCLCALPDPLPARAWVDCTLPADRDAADCFDACPTLGNGCVDPFQTTSTSCNTEHHDGFVAVTTCLVAK